MKEYRIQKLYDDDHFTEIFQITQIKDNKVILTVRPKDGNLLDTLKSKLKKELLVYSGYLKQEIGVLRSNIGLSSVWKMVLKGKEVAKAEIKGVQYFTVKITDGKQGFSGKTTDLNEIELIKGRDFSSCAFSTRQDKNDKLDLLIKLDCKVSPEALLTFGVALDNKFLFDSE
ncbi:MAG: hypothetical protein HeimC2_27520 [Candidatus Heimdallarchaeota archaeon LC_2]|nr:MAG: hypothetical protein HeimC2_27520 [Candidatus Heimdallarchaeota archaeon LC_2]